MATKKQKEELMQTLKFTPVRARLLVQGYGGECYIGSVDRKDYEAFKKGRVDIEQYMSDWDNEFFQDIPDKNRFVEPGQAYECDNLFHGSGASMDSGSYINVLNDETNQDIFETNLDHNSLDDAGITVECGDDFDSDDLEPGSVIFWGGQGEKGCFFDAELTLTKPFDPKLLKLTYSNGDGWHLLTGVEYDGVELEGYDGYSTTGKWGEHKFWISGDEEVYESVYRDEEDEDEDNDTPESACDSEWDPAAELDKIQVPVLESEETWASRVIDESMLSPWHGADLVPAHEGEYEVEFVEAKWPFSISGHFEFRDGRWHTPNGLEVKQWRGLKEPA
jgi:hypothetical protein